MRPCSGSWSGPWGKSARCWPHPAWTLVRARWPRSTLIWAGMSVPASARVSMPSWSMGQQSSTACTTTTGPLSTTHSLRPSPPPGGLPGMSYRCTSPRSWPPLVKGGSTAWPTARNSSTSSPWPSTWCCGPGPDGVPPIRVADFVPTRQEPIAARGAPEGGRRADSCFGHQPGSGIAEADLPGAPADADGFLALGYRPAQVAAPEARPRRGGRRRAPASHVPGCNGALGSMSPGPRGAEQSQAMGISAHQVGPDRREGAREDQHRPSKRRRMAPGTASPSVIGFQPRHAVGNRPSLDPGELPDRIGPRSQGLEAAVIAASQARWDHEAALSTHSDR